MANISRALLLCFSLVASVGAASAQGLGDASAMSNSVGAAVSSMDGMRSSVTLGGGSANPFAQAASSLADAPAATGIDIAAVQAKIGGGTDLSLPAKPLSGASQALSANMANAVGGSPSAPGGDLTASVVLGAATPDLSNAIGDQVRSSLRLGK